MPQPLEEVYFELTQVGTIMRVAAIDAATGTEVVIQGPAKLSPETLKKTALAKLCYVMKKKKAGR